MKRSITKLWMLVLILALIISVSIGCTDKPPSSEGQVQAGDGKPDIEDNLSDDSEQTSQGTLPIVKEPITLTYWLDMDPKMSATLKTYGDMLFYQELEKKTGVKIKFIHPPVDQGAEQFNLMLASQDLPDIIEWGWSTIAGGPDKAINDGVIINLTDLIQEHAPDYKRILDENPQVLRDVITDNGDHYMFPNLFIDESMRVMSGHQIRKDWLDKLGLSAPTTMDEWYDVLVAFKQNDPNGNGKADEIPYIAIGLAGEKGLANFTAAWGIPYGFYVDDGKIKYGPMEDSYKDFLVTMNKWYTEKLIDQDFPTTDNKTHDAYITGNIAGAWTAGLMGGMGRYLQLMKEEDPPEFDLQGVSRPKINPNDTAYDYFTSPSAVSGHGAAITTKNEYVVESVKWINYQYSEEGHYLYNFGVEGITYNMENGYPKFTELITNNPEGWSLDQAIGHYARGNSGTGPHVADPRAYEQRAAMPQQIEAKKIWSEATTERSLPRITPTGEESQKIATIMNEINTYRDEMTLRMIMGQEPIDKFDEYLENLNKMGIEEAINMYQTALERYKTRK